MINETTHKIHFRSADNLSEIEDNSVALIVTSPPYPMIEMWDESFSTQNIEIAETLKKVSLRVLIR
jgi:modification methylase